MKYVVRINNKDYEVVVEKGQANLVNTTEVVAAPAAPIAAAPAAAGAGVAGGARRIGVHGRNDRACRRRRLSFRPKSGIPR